MKQSMRVRGVIGGFSLVIVGVALGVAADRIILAHHAPETNIPAGDDHAAVVAFRHVLELDDDQLAEIHRILIRNQASVDEAWQSLRVGMSEGIANAHDEIRALLTEEQLGLFEDWLDRHVRGADGDASLLWPH